MKLFLVPAAALLALALSACAGNRYCLSEQEYQKAENLQPIQPVEGLALPESASALRIPPPPAEVVPFGTRNAEGDGVCLDRPPPLKSTDQER